MIALNDVVIGIAVVALLLTGAAAIYRVGRGPTLADRIAALDVLLVSLMSGVAVRAAATGNTSNLVVAVVIAIIGFVATVAATRFIEGRAQREAQS